ncbi:cache domain-containing sensor histidine kinase [Clostridium uliginosum]|uniref:Two-component system, sensor histidine kinase YesM n=1 Tax=Clostridium uliginosum TaxID=119641 RepID=A0A1I1ICJ4_9CLOT|nr:sensor histidine kinase [Clostridium uliginosum]SFC30960.1 two-component system, sensor histidine kinase YesM [Clostridium uliginosum]
MLKNNFTFKRKLLIAFLIVGIIPLISLWIYDTVFIIKSTYEKIDSFTNSNIKIAAELIDTNINTYEKMVNYIAENYDVQSIMEKENKSENTVESRFDDTQELYKISKAILATQSTEIPLHIVSLDKTSRFSTTNYYYPIYTDARGDFYEELSKNEDRVVKKIHRRVDGENSKDTVLSIGKSIVDKKTKQIIGYVIADVYDSYFDDIFEATSFVKNSNVMILDDNGYIVTDKNYKGSTGFKLNSEYLLKMNADSGVIEISMNGKDYLGYYTSANKTKIKVMELIPKEYFLGEILSNVKLIIILTFFVVIIAVCFAIIMSKKISKPIVEIRTLMKEVEKGNFKVSIKNYTADEIGELSRGFNDMIKEIDRLILEDYKKELLVQQAEFKSLKSQVNPHFLYNSLGVISWMARLGEIDSVVEATDALANFFRYNVNSNEDTVTVKKECEQINSYLTVQNYRYKDRFEINIDIQEDILEYRILKLMLQPLVENAIVHGLEEKVGQGTLIINGFKDGDNLCFQIKDNGVGIENSKTKGEGIGLNNLDKRIKLFYGERYGVFYTKEEEFTVFSVIVPKKEEKISD